MLVVYEVQRIGLYVYNGRAIIIRFDNGDFIGIVVSIKRTGYFLDGIIYERSTTR